MAALAVLIGAVLSIAVTAACGKEGPPLPPLRPEPGHIREVSAVRVDDRIELRLQIPPANFDGTTPPVIDRVEIYMMAAPAATPAPGATELLHEKHRLAIIPVARAAAAPADPPAKAPAAVAPGTVVAGDTAVFVDRIDAALIGAKDAPVRYYLAVGATGRSRRGRPSPVMAVPLAKVVAAPAEVIITYDETTLRLTWTPSPGQTFRVFEGQGPTSPSKELTPAPIEAGTFALPLTFGAERCFAIQPIELTARVSILGPVGRTTCVTPADTFRPPAPSGLLAVQEAAGITLRWNGVAAEDLAGYHVLRGEGTGENMQQLFKAPLTGTSYVDTAITPGITYVYVVIAVDKAGNISEQSNQQQVTARAAAGGRQPGTE